MAVVMEIKCRNGATVRVHDDCYRDASPEEITRRKQRILNIIWQIDRNNQLRQLEAKRQAEG